MAVDRQRRSKRAHDLNCQRCCTGMKPTSRKNRTSGFYEGTEIAVDQLVEHVIAMK